MDELCEQFISTEGRYCEQPAEYHDDVRNKAYCAAHTAAWREFLKQSADLQRREKLREYCKLCYGPCRLRGIERIIKKREES